ncbi:MAG: adenylate/guanylate cyclase domain-containing protein [Syntrophobacteraceae bacterium]|jgi:adenylate cyclase|nr:adenylate/guanylate cyclase domain-containing protein [Syntrophobacteraceae bacterium]
MTSSRLARLKDSRALAAVIISGLVFLALLGLRRAGRLEALELLVYDGLINIQPKGKTAGQRVTLIRITDDDIREEGSWPLTDSRLSEGLGLILRHGPRAVGVDIFRDRPVPPGTGALGELFRGNRHVVGVFKFGPDGLPPPPVLEGTDRVGFNDVLVDAAGTVRRALLFLDDGAISRYSLAYRLAVLYLRQEGIAPRGDPLDPEHLRLGPSTIRPLQSDAGGYIGADERGYQFLLDFRDEPRSFPSFSFSDLMGGRVPAGALKDRAVILGVEAHGVKDFFHTPYSRVLPPDQQVSGILLHAHATSQLLRLALGESTPVGTLPEAGENAWILMACLAGGALGLRAHTPWHFAAFLATGLLVILGAALAAFLGGWWIPLAPPCLGWAGSASVAAAWGFSHEHRERAVLMRLFAQHVSPVMAEAIWRQREQFMDGGRPRSLNLVATVLFSDLEGFTPVAEKMDPLLVTEWLNSYLETMAQLVMDHGGVVDDYFGDGIKANFGVPVPRISEEETRRDAVSAMRCALAMARGMRGFNDHWEGRGMPAARLRVGIHTGTVVATTIGSLQRLKYTTVGNPVNIAARLESCEPFPFDAWMPGYPCRVLLSEVTARCAGDDFCVRDIGELSLKGQEKSVRVFFLEGPGA